MALTNCTSFHLISSMPSSICLLPIFPFYPNFHPQKQQLPSLPPCRNSLQKKLLALEHPESRVSTSIRATDHHVLHSGRWNIKKLCCGEPDNVLIGGASPDGIQHQFMECSKFTGTMDLLEGHPKCSIFREEAMEAMAEALDCRFCNENVQEKEKALRALTMLI